MEDIILIAYLICVCGYAYFSFSKHCENVRFKLYNAIQKII